MSKQHILEGIYKDTRNVVYYRITKTWHFLMEKLIDEKQAKKAFENT